MAFCYRSDRKINFEENQYPEVGPGKYLKLWKSKPKRNKIPFNSSSPKLILLTNNNPGIGTYNINNSIFEKISHKSNTNKSINEVGNSSFSKISNNLTNISTIEKSIHNNNIINQEKLGFWTKAGRFKPLKKEEIIDFNNTINNQNLNKSLKKSHSFINIKNNKNNNLKTGSLDRILSIQSKQMNGYGIGHELAKVKLNIDVSSLNENTPGPGYYNPLIKTKNKILNWEKSNNNNDTKENKFKEFKKDIIEDMEKKGSIKKTNETLNNKKEHTIYSSYKEHLFNLNLKKNVLSEINKDIKDLLNDIPGPGYYEKEFDKNSNGNLEKKNKRNLKFKKNVSNSIQNFGSECVRFIHQSKSTENIGPTTYFNDKKLRKKSHKTYYDLMKRNYNNSDDEENKIKQNYNQISPGPGSYNLIKSFIKHSSSQREFLNTSEIRFKNENFNNNYPGPGSYIKTINKKENNTEKINENRSYEIFDDININKDKIKKIQEQKKKSPGAGYYFPDIINSIQYKNIIKLNPVQSIHAGFLKSSKRFEDFKPINDLSPASYNPYFYEKVKFKTINPSVFNTNEKRFLSLKKDNKFVGPGYYNIDNNNWNKRSFNVLFL